MLEILLCACAVYGLFSAAIQLWLLLWGGRGVLCVPLDAACGEGEALRKLNRARRTAFIMGLGMPVAIDRGTSDAVLSAVQGAGYSILKS